MMSLTEKKRDRERERELSQSKYLENYEVPLALPEMFRGVQFTDPYRHGFLFSIKPYQPIPGMA